MIPPEQIMEEAIERASRVDYNKSLPRTDWDELHEHEREDYRDEIRALVEACAPDIYAAGYQAGIEAERERIKQELKALPSVDPSELTDPVDVDALIARVDRAALPKEEGK